MNKIFAVFVVGPTASGKTSLAVQIAKRFNGEIVSADSMQIYKEMSIATAKPTQEEMGGIAHHMIDFLPVSETFSVALYKDMAMGKIYDIVSRGKLPIIVGGTGLYIDALINNTYFLQSDDSESVRLSLMQRERDEGILALYDELQRIDKDAAEKIHINNSKKIIRALEVYYTTGKTLTRQNELSHLNGQVLDALIIGLNAAQRQVLYDRINLRVDQMVKDGLIDEAEKFFSLHGVKTAGQAIGYKELLPYFQGGTTLEEAISSLKMQTRHYAKRQLTWFRRNENIIWFDIDRYTKEELIEQVIRTVEGRLKNEKIH